MNTKLLLTAGALTCLALGDFALAQEEVEEVVVTGSRIRQNPLDKTTPVQTLSAEDMETSGQVSLGEFLQRLPIAGSGINRNNNSSGNLGFPPDGSGIGAGASEIDLRYLSSKRVLVLVDGKRWVRGSSASGVSGAVDLNTIPVNAIQRVEVLQDGASVIYGSDAIAGVVNIITNEQYEGLDVSAYYGAFDEGDGESMEYAMSFGAEGDNSRVFVAASYTEQRSVSAGDREISQYPIPGWENGASSGTPQGRFAFYEPRNGDAWTSITLNDGVLNDGGLNIPVYDPLNPDSGDFHNFATADRFNYQPYNHLVTPNERVNLFMKGEFDFSENTTLRLTAAFNNRTSQNQAAPEPLFAGPGGGGGAWMEAISFDVSNPYNPFGITIGPNEIQDGFVTRRPLEAGPRVFDQNVDTWHVAAMLDGELNFGERDWYWDVHAAFAQNQANQRKQGAFNARNLLVAVGPTAVCDATPGCVYFNWFGGQGPNGEGSITQDMLDFVTFTQKDESQQEMTNVTANISGDLFDMPAGPAGVAVGFEYREEKGFFVPDSVVSRGETAGIPASPTDGGFDVTEFYGEIMLPIFTGFDISAAARFSDYDITGSNTVAKIGANWRPTDTLTLRANFSEITDPCDADALAVDPSNAANCATLGVPPGYQQLNPQISVTTGGNEDLTPEESEMWTVGLTWDGSEVFSGLGGFTFEMNYYDITVDNAIQAPDAGNVLTQCVQTLDPIYCDNVTRVGATVTRIDGILLNIGGIETTGLDWSVSFVTNEQDWGSLDVTWANTHLFDYTEFTEGPDGVISTSREGTELGSPERGYLEWRSTLTIGWSNNDWRVTAINRYMDSLTEQCTGLVADFGMTDLCTTPTTNTIDATFYTDVQATWTPSNLGGRWSFQAGIQNLFDEDTPICYSCDLNSFDGTLHPVSGSFWFARVGYSLD
jgi:iron complex outermembrane receptor protein